MTLPYLDLEKSRAKGKPRELYHFYQSTTDWYYTSFRTSIIYAGGVYTPLEITRSEIEGGGQDKPGAVDITVPTNSAIGLIMQEGSSPFPISVDIYRFHADSPTDTIVIFKGEVGGASIEGEVCTIQAVPLQARMTMILPRGLFQRSRCVWNTYDPLTCKVNPAAFTFAGTVSAITGLTVTVPGAEVFGETAIFGKVFFNFFEGGVLTKGNRKGLIESQAGDDLILEFAIKGLVVGDAVSLLAGDDRTPETCLNKFNNIARNMSFKNIPVINPFTGQGLRQ